MDSLNSVGGNELRAPNLIDCRLPALELCHDAPSTRRPCRDAVSEWPWDDRASFRRPGIGPCARERGGDGQPHRAAVLRKAGAPTFHQVLLPMSLVAGEGPQGG